ncbi:PREDICTED: leucine--tRNA ligase, chloroplastic/mitochondrial-like isoform X1 [Nicotiana attenuata]|nr:PREDICTED: leucine--tRNA ligase, chloroplastic/mitochondrial-like isoform X1 [Nicotiana attenuata]XP_019251665.1 PREDICTED: leucine--tRNA ligase, chloroplastic/mitochondrial-like isoform X1 [Nicotiana attenuata]
MRSGDFFVLKDNPNIRLIARAHKMSKTRGNVINPDDVVLEYGADSLCLYEMFMGPLRDSKTWNTSGIEGVHRFLARSWRLIVSSTSPTGSYPDGTSIVDEKPSIEQLPSLHRCIDKVNEEIEGTRFNTGISAMMEIINAAYKADAAYLKESTVVLPVQINGKTRGTIQVEETCTEEEAFRLPSLDTKLSKFLDGKSIRKRIYVQGKILNIVIDAQKKVKVAQE